MSSNIKSQHLHKQNNSWYIRTGHIHHFLCKCGQTDSFGNILSVVHHPDNCCSGCGNSHYLDTLMFLSSEKVVRWSVFHWHIEKIKTKQEWIVRTYASIPVFDYAIQKIRFRKIIFSTRSMSLQGKLDKHESYPIVLKKYVYNHLIKATQIKELMNEELKHVLYAFILEAPKVEIAWIKDEKINKRSLKERTQLLSFFLGNDHLKEYDFFYWDNFNIFKDISKQYPSVKKMLFFISSHRKEKSIKRAYIESYERSMEIYARYNHMADHLFSRHIEDRNFLVELINMDTKVKHTLFDEVAMITVEYFLEFLREHYTQKSVTKLFTVLDEQSFRYHNIVRDTIWMFRGEAMHFIREHFRKVPPTFQRIHNEFIRINTMRDASLNGKVEFEYEENNLKAQTKKDLFDYCLPETTHILQWWSQQLHNCMYGYSRSIHQGKTIIYGVFKDDILTYAIEIRGNKIVQALGKHNRRIEEEERAKINAWFKEIYIATWIKSPRGD